MHAQNNQNILSLKKFKEIGKLNETLQQEPTDIGNYEKDYRYFKNYAERIDAALNGETLVLYLHYLLKEQRVKKNTFNRRYFACKKMLELDGITLSEEESQIVKQLRKHYRLEENKDLAKPKGKQPVDSDELLALIADVKDERMQAILYVQFYTGNRPSEMVRLQAKDFNLDNGVVSVYLKKQKDTKDKRLPLVCVNAVRRYFKKYQLSGEDYFVGAVNKHGDYASREITLSCYNRLLRRAPAGVSAYVYRKTLVKRLYANGAEVQKIKLQTGHASERTIVEHYLQVDLTEIDKYF